ncbi:MAG: trehalose-phosphatase [candidate division FCPU426 bacterium]
MARWFFTSVAGRKPARDLAAWQAARPRLLLLDFDGTLSPIVASPGRARLAPGMRQVLSSLGRSQGTAVALLSGRSLPDLKQRVGVPGLYYLGNHGASGYGAPAVSPARRERSRRLAAALRPLLRRWPGALLESKGLDLSLHYRQVAPKRVAGLLTAARAAAAGHPFDLRDGKKVLEFRLPGARGKGDAANRLARSLARGWRRTGLCLCLGDDATDEDAFAAIKRLGPRAHSFKVGTGPTVADYRLRDVGEVGRLLRALAGPVQSTTGRRTR